MLTSLRRRFATSLTGLAVRCVVMAALVMAAFAHRGAMAVPVPAELAAYVLPDGSLPDICLTGDTNDTGHDHASVACEFCLIAGSAGLPAPVADGIRYDLPVARADGFLAAPAAVVAGFFRAGTPVRGPPVLSA